MFRGLLNLAAVRGGVHPHSHKDRSSALQILKAPVPKRLYLPLLQHAGEAAVPIVERGAYVFKGQLLALAPSDLSAPVHASSSGHIVDICEVAAAHPSGLTAPAIVLETDGEDKWAPADEGAALTDAYSEDAMTLANRVANAGIVGMGGAIFPAAVKLKQGAKHEIKTLLVNGSECEPYLSCDDRLMREQAEAIVEGARLIRHILKAFRVVIAIEDNKREAIAAMQAAAEPYGMVEVEVVPTRYPMGSAKQLIQQITGREVPAGARSTSVGVLVHNVGTVYAIYQALTRARPLISRVVTVAGACIKRPRNIEARIGTPVQDLIDLCGGFIDKAEVLLLGGPMMGIAMQSTEVPIIKGATGVLALAKHELRREQSSACIRCARCVSACPMGLLPLDIAAQIKQDNFEAAADYGLNDCILCASCSYVCPSQLPLVQYFRYAKDQQAQKHRAAKKMNLTVSMSLAKQQRLADEKQQKAEEKAAKRAAKKKTRTRSKQALHENGIKEAKADSTQIGEAKVITEKTAAEKEITNEATTREELAHES
ncbi:electron transport complex subunit RsxC [Agaribacterium haliotis]|uniref:electron transport complex subunit RsxC n=1 Tax=Agaribacterium haliotis TaxID=2013869 RepID=UPI000BB53F19|nr:electron transport complex subunit RsxC [Agaribacterium haliotis]